MSDELETAANADAERNLMVVRLTAEGRSKSYIQSQTGVPATLQRKINEEFKHYSRNNLYTQQRSREIIGYFDEHTASLIEQMYTVVDEADMNGNYKDKANALKNIFEMEVKRVDALQKAGVISSQDIGEEVAVMQVKYDKLKELLKLIANKHPDAARDIVEGIRDMDNIVESERVG